MIKTSIEIMRLNHTHIPFFIYSLTFACLVKAKASKKLFKFFKRLLGILLESFRLTKRFAFLYLSGIEPTLVDHFNLKVNLLHKLDIFLTDLRPFP
jgi:hypothetical protein